MLSSTTTASSENVRRAISKSPSGGINKFHGSSPFRRSIPESSARLLDAAIRRRIVDSVTSCLSHSPKPDVTFNPAPRSNDLDIDQNTCCSFNTADIFDTECDNLVTMGSPEYSPAPIPSRNKGTSLPLPPWTSDFGMHHRLNCLLFGSKISGLPIINTGNNNAVSFRVKDSTPTTNINTTTTTPPFVNNVSISTNQNNTSEMLDCQTAGCILGRRPFLSGLGYPVVTWCEYDQHGFPRTHGKGGVLEDIGRDRKKIYDIRTWGYSGEANGGRDRMPFCDIGTRGYGGQANGGRDRMKFYDKISTGVKAYDNPDDAMQNYCDSAKGFGGGVSQIIDYGDMKCLGSPIYGCHSDYSDSYIVGVGRKEIQNHTEHCGKVFDGNTRMATQTQTFSDTDVAYIAFLLKSLRKYFGPFETCSMVAQNRYDTVKPNNTNKSKIQDYGNRGIPRRNLARDGNKMKPHPVTRKQKERPTTYEQATRRKQVWPNTPLLPQRQQQQQKQTQRLNRKQNHLSHRHPEHIGQGEYQRHKIPQQKQQQQQIQKRQKQQQQFKHGQRQQPHCAPFTATTAETWPHTNTTQNENASPFQWMVPARGAIGDSDSVCSDCCLYCGGDNRCSYSWSNLSSCRSYCSNSLQIDMEAIAEYNRNAEHIRNAKYNRRAEYKKNAEYNSKAELHHGYNDDVYVDDDHDDDTISDCTMSPVGRVLLTSPPHRPPLLPTPPPHRPPPPPPSATSIEVPNRNCCRSSFENIVAVEGNPRCSTRRTKKSSLNYKHTTTISNTKPKPPKVTKKKPIGKDVAISGRHALWSTVPKPRQPATMIRNQFESNESRHVCDDGHLGKQTATRRLMSLLCDFNESRCRDKKLDFVSLASLLTQLIKHVAAEDVSRCHEGKTAASKYSNYAISPATAKQKENGLRFNEKSSKNKSRIEFGKATRGKRKGVQAKARPKKKKLTPLESSSVLPDGQKEVSLPLCTWHSEFIPYRRQPEVCPDSQPCLCPCQAVHESCLADTVKQTHAHERDGGKMTDMLPTRSYNNSCCVEKSRRQTSGHNS